MAHSTAQSPPKDDPPIDWSAMSDHHGPAPRSSLILSLNAGSSSLKISLYRLTSPSTASPSPVTLLLKSSLSSINHDATFSFSTTDPSLSSETTLKDEPAPNVHDHATGFAHFLTHLQRAAGIDPHTIAFACHRIVHGGTYRAPVLITARAYAHIARLSDLAPLHNGAALSVVGACVDALPHARSVAYFDTAFHQTIPEHIAAYAIDQRIARRKGLRKYGFHGLSYAFIVDAVSKFLKKPASETNLIALHLGSGASACAIQHGQSLDTSMGLTPAAGLPGATRAGTLDPTLIFHYTHAAAKITHARAGSREVGITEAEQILNKKAGWNAVAGTTDFGEIVRRRGHALANNSDEHSSKNGNEADSAHGGQWDKTSDAAAVLAFDLFVDRVLDHVGAYFVKLGGKVDALVFAGGIGERSAEVRREVVRRCACLGFVLDGDGDGTAREGEGEQVVYRIGKNVLVCQTDEQMQMASECARESSFWEQDWSA